MPESAPKVVSKKLGEPVVTRHFDLPESLNKRLVREGKVKGQVNIVREGIERVLSGPNNLSATDTKTAMKEALVELGVVTPKGDDEVIYDVSVTLDKVRRTRLSELAKALGFAEVSHLLKDLAYRALDDPGATEKYLFAHLDEAPRYEAQAEGTTSGRARSKAA